MRILNNLINGKKRRITLLLLLFIFISTFFFSISLAYRNGISGQTNNGCTCHGTANTSTILSPSTQSGLWTVMAGSTNTFSVTVANSNRAHAGVNIAVKTASDGNTNAGSLSPVSGYGLQLSSSELTHTNAKPYSGSAEYKFTWTAPDTPGTYYLKAVGNAVDSNNQNSNDQWNYMSVRTIVVEAPPSVKVTSPNGGEGFCPGSTKNITWTFESISNVKIELSSNGGSTFETVLQASTPANAGSWAWVIPSNLPVGNTYKIRISDPSNSGTFDVSDNNFSISAQTSINQQPQSITACTGKQAQFSVVAAGINLSYQWRKNGQNIPNSNSATYTISPVETQSAGSYDCVVNGACGNAVTTTAAVLTVDSSPSINVQPVSKTVCIGQSASFSVVANGTNITYQWKKDGQNIPNQTESTITFANSAVTDAGTYQVLISGKCEPPISSQQVTLSVPQLPVITTEPKSQTLCEGSKLLLFANVTGTNLTFSWWKNNAELSGSNNDTLIINNVASSDNGTYFIKVATDCDLSSSSSQVTVTVNPKPVITKEPTDLVVGKGLKAEFIITASGDNLQYQWLKGGNNIANANLSKFTITSVSVTDNGLYSCKVSNSCGEVTSKPAQLTVQEIASAVLNFPENPLNIGRIEAGKSKTSAFKDAFENLGELVLTVNSVTLTGTDASDFEVLNLTLPLTLAKNEKSPLNIKFSPKTPGQKNAVLKFNSNSIGSGELALSAFAVDLKIDIAQNELIFNFTEIGNVISNELTIINNCNADLDGKLSISGPGAGNFSIKSLDNFALKQKNSYVGTIAFEALTNSNVQADLNIEFSEFNYKIVVPLKANNVNSITDDLLNFSVEILPNPATNGIFINLNNINGNNVEVRIYDANGMLVRILNSDNSGENIKLPWDLLDSYGKSVSNGLYNAIIIINGKVYKKPLLIVK